MPLRLLAIVLVGLAVPSLAQAHEVRPGYLALNQTAEENYDVFWKVPASGNMKLGIYVRLPENCTTTREVISTSVVPVCRLARQESVEPV